MLEWRPVARDRGHSSVGRAPALQAGGRRFDPVWLHHFEPLCAKRKSNPPVEGLKAKKATRAMPEWHGDRHAGCKPASLIQVWPERLLLPDLRHRQEKD